MTTLAVTMGDPAGIGPDVILSAWEKRHALGLPSFLTIADPAVLKARAAMLGLDVPLMEADADAAPVLFGKALPVLPVAIGTPVLAGKAEPAAADAVIASIEAAVRLTMAGKTAAIVTAPIAKSVLYAAGFAFPGHTEFLADLARRATGEPCHPVMMLAGPELRTVPVTIHIPFADVPAALSSDAIERTVRIAERALRDRFSIERPRIAISGLNPHAGEGGALGSEEETIICPAVERLRQAGLAVTGPLPADTMFHPAARAGYDVAICMYHDQALIPAKMIGFDDAVNVTLGLPFVRTSPDHGTAFSIAGGGLARPDSFIAALRLADVMSRAKAAS